MHNSVVSGAATDVLKDPPAIAERPTPSSSMLGLASYPSPDEGDCSVALAERPQPIDSVSRPPSRPEAAPAREATITDEAQDAGAASSTGESLAGSGLRRAGEPGAPGLDHGRLSPRSVDQLKSENNRLTEQLVEASLTSAQNFESFSNDRNALWRFAQDLRQRVQSEQLERARCEALLSSTREALEKLRAENLQMSEDLLRLLS